MKEITVKFIPALNGDSFLLTSSDFTMLVDGGYLNTYDNFIKPCLIELAQENKTISLLVSSHIDTDHISGLIKLLEENNKNKFIEIENIWHNSFRHLQSQKPIDNTINDSNSFKTVKKEIETQSKKDISGEQGSSLGALILKGNYLWNSQFEGNRISTDNKKEIAFNDNIKIILLSPDDIKLDNLRNDWETELYIKGYLDVPHSEEFWDDAFHFLSANNKPRPRKKIDEISHNNEFDIERTVAESKYIPDSTPTNGSSISFILEIDDKRLLFLADSHSDIITKRLKEIYGMENTSIYFDLIKISHHGSFSNNDPELIRMINSDRYLFSTNGKVYNHPDLETIAWILNQKGKKIKKLYFNYPLDICTNTLKSSELKKMYNYEIIYSSGEEIIEINL